jgi:cell wall-associated NlpC family hydrolase
MAPPAVLPGDVLCVRTSGRAAWWIRFGSAIRGVPDLSNHVAVAHHVDAHGTMWCLEGRPGGVGWRDATAYLSSPWTLTNAAQPKTGQQRAQVCKVMEALVGTPYDWQAIVADGVTDLGWHLPGWEPDWHGTVPGHVDCSSAAAYAYAKTGLAGPGGERGCQPSDWDAFILAAAWAGQRAGEGSR